MVAEIVGENLVEGSDNGETVWTLNVADSISIKESAYGFGTAHDFVKRL